MAIGTGRTGEAPPDDLRGRALRGVLWTAAEKWSVRLSTFVGFVLLGRQLGPEEFGVVALAMTFITLLGFVTDAGLSPYLVQVRQLTSTISSTAFYISVALGIVLAGALAALAGPISSVLDAPPLEPVLIALAGTLVLSGLSSVPAALLKKELRFRELALRQVSSTVLSVVVAVVLAFAGAGVWALVAQTLVRSTVATVILWRATDFRPRLTFSGAQARTMTAFGVKAMAVNLGNQMREQGEIFIIGVIAGTTALGFWTVAGRLVGVISGLCTAAFGIVAGSVFARLQDDPPRLARALSKSLGTAALVVVPVMVALSLVSTEVVPAVFGQQWVPASGIAAVLAVRAVISTLSDFDRHALMATGHPGAELAITLGSLVVQMGLVVVFADGDLVLMALVLTAWRLVSWPVRSVVVHRLLLVPYRTYASTAVILLAGGVAAGAVLGAQAGLELDGPAFVALALGVGAVVYPGVVLLLDRAPLVELVGTLRSTLTRRRSA